MYKRKGKQCKASKKMARQVDKVCSLYHNDTMSMNEIADVYKTNIGVVQYFFKIYDIESREKTYRPKYRTESTRRAWSDREQIKSLYLESKKSASDLSKIYNISNHSVYKILKATGVQVRKMTAKKHNQNVWCNTDEIIDLYLNEGLSRVEISKFYECSHKTIENVLIENDVPLRKYSKSVKTQNVRNDAEKIAKLYTVDKLTLTALAELYNTSIGTVKSVLISVNAYKK